jgi:SagB-type dehydrogenase family enzyme
VRDLAFRRSPHVVTFWQRGEHLIFNYATGVVVRGSSLAIEVLDGLGKWTTWNRLSRNRSPEEQRLLRRLVDLMVRRTFVTRSDERREVEEKLSTWRTWNPAAGFFHFATKDVKYSSQVVETVAVTGGEGRSKRAPAPLKTEYRAGVRLPPAQLAGEIPSLLLARRTWREFGRQPIKLTDLATLLQLTWGVHGWIQIPRVGPLALKTSPSGGARHSIEVYVLARKVSSLDPGLYHYEPDAHRLARIGRRRARAVTDYIPGQHWYKDAGAVFLMTTVFERVHWRYYHARAYRAILAEAGHLCQTFCLVATWLGLAPFCTMGLSDRRIESDLEIDGVSESIIYAAGVGSRPKGVEWAPLPGTKETPVVFPPAHKAVRHKAHAATLTRRRDRGRRTRPTDNS